MQDRSFQRQLGARRDAAAADIAAHPELVLAPQLAWYRRVRIWNRLQTVRMNGAGIHLQHRKAMVELAWRDVTKWSRTGLADWTLHAGERQVSILVKADHGFTAEDMRRVEGRLIYHVASLPEASLRDDAVNAYRNWRERVSRGRRRASYTPSRRSEDLAKPIDAADG
jgi:hypothetical protein